MFGRSHNGEQLALLLDPIKRPHCVQMSEIRRPLDRDTSTILLGPRAMRSCKRGRIFHDANAERAISRSADSHGNISDSFPGADISKRTLFLSGIEGRPWLGAPFPRTQPRPSHAYKRGPATDSVGAQRANSLFRRRFRRTRTAVAHPSAASGHSERTAFFGVGSEEPARQ